MSNPALDRVREEGARPWALYAATPSNFFGSQFDSVLRARRRTGRLVRSRPPLHGAPHPDDLGMLESDPDAFAPWHTMSCSTERSPVAAVSTARSRAPGAGLSECSGYPRQGGRARFGFPADGLRGGAPPHGGIAFGFDRISMLSPVPRFVRDVIDSQEPPRRVRCSRRADAGAERGIQRSTHSGHRPGAGTRGRKARNSRATEDGAVDSKRIPSKAPTC